jgi:hypothetical protein
MDNICILLLFKHIKIVNQKGLSEVFNQMEYPACMYAVVVTSYRLYASVSAARVFGDARRLVKPAS